MPDLVSHLCAAYFFKYSLHELRRNRFFFYFGTILPDIATRPFYILYPDLFWFVYPLHTFLGTFLLVLVVTYLFEATVRKAVFMSIYAGCLLHILLDSLQEDIFKLYYWFYPFSKIHLGLDLFSIDESIKVMPVFILLVIIVEFSVRSRKFLLKRTTPKISIKHR